VLGDAHKASAKKDEKLLDVAAELLASKLVAVKPWRFAKHWAYAYRP
jgi:hypothetical protein